MVKVRIILDPNAEKMPTIPLSELEFLDSPYAICIKNLVLTPGFRSAVIDISGVRYSFERG